MTTPVGTVTNAYIESFSFGGSQSAVFGKSSDDQNTIRVTVKLETGQKTIPIHIQIKPGKNETDPSGVNTNYFEAPIQYPPELDELNVNFENFIKEVVEKPVTSGGAGFNLFAKNNKVTAVANGQLLSKASSGSPVVLKCLNGDISNGLAFVATLVHEKALSKDKFTYYLEEMRAKTIRTKTENELLKPLLNALQQFTDADNQMKENVKKDIRDMLDKHKTDIGEELAKAVGRILDNNDLAAAEKEAQDVMNVISHEIERPQLQPSAGAPIGNTLNQGAQPPVVQPPEHVAQPPVVQPPAPPSNVELDADLAERDSHPSNVNTGTNWDQIAAIFNNIAQHFFPQGSDGFDAEDDYTTPDPTDPECFDLFETNKKQEYLKKALDARLWTTLNPDNFRDVFQNGDAITKRIISAFGYVGTDSDTNQKSRARVILPHILSILLYQNDKANNVVQRPDPNFEVCNQFELILLLKSYKMMHELVNGQMQNDPLEVFKRIHDTVNDLDGYNKLTDTQRKMFGILYPEKAKAILGDRFQNYTGPTSWFELPFQQVLLEIDAKTIVAYVRSFIKRNSTTFGKELFANLNQPVALMIIMAAVPVSIVGSIPEGKNTFDDSTVSEMGTVAINNLQQQDLGFLSQVPIDVKRVFCFPYRNHLSQQTMDAIKQTVEDRQTVESRIPDNYNEWDHLFKSIFESADVNPKPLLSTGRTPPLKSLWDYSLEWFQGFNGGQVDDSDEDDDSPDQTGGSGGSGQGNHWRRQLYSFKKLPLQFSKNQTMKKYKYH